MCLSAKRLPKERRFTPVGQLWRYDRLWTVETVRKYMTLADNLAFLETAASELRAERNEGPLQNDVYEEIDDIRNLCIRAAAVDTRVNYPVRAESEMKLVQKLRAVISNGAEKDRERYLPLLDRAEEMVQQIAQIPVPPDGHLGVLRLIRGHFGFLIDEYRFTVTDEQPTNMRLASGAVTINLGWATQSSLSFSLCKAERGDFWIEDLLYLHGDPRYRSVPQALQLNTEADVDEWFRFIASVLRQFADELLKDKPGAFDRIAQAQAKRDIEYAAMMNEKCGVR